MPVTLNIIQTAKHTIKASVLANRTVIRLASDMIAPEKRLRGASSTICLYLLSTSSFRHG